MDVQLLGISIEQFQNDAEGVKLYTGLENYKTFVDVLASLGPSAFQLNYLYGNPSVDV